MRTRNVCWYIYTFSLEVVVCRKTVTKKNEEEEVTPPKAIRTIMGATNYIIIHTHVHGTTKQNHII